MDMKDRDIENAISYYKKASEYKPNEFFTPRYIMKLAMAYEVNKAATLSGEVLGYIGQLVAKKEDNVAAGLLDGFRAGLAGRAKVDAPKEWETIEKQLRASKNAQVVFAADALGVLFGDGAALADLRTMAGNGELEPVTREEAIQALASVKDEQAVPIFFNLIGGIPEESAA